MLTNLVAVATVVGALVAVITLLTSLTRPARLRREEALWRQAWEANNEPVERRLLLEDMHRHVLADLVSIKLVPSKEFVTGWFFLLVPLFVLAQLIGLATYQFASEPDVSWWAHLTGNLLAEDVIAVPVVSLLFPLGSTAWLMSRLEARRSVARQAIANQYPLAVPNHLRVSWAVLGLWLAALSGTAAMGVLGGLTWWQWQQDHSQATFDTVYAWLPGAAILGLSLAISIITGVSASIRRERIRFASEHAIIGAATSRAHEGECVSAPPFSPSPSKSQHSGSLRGLLVGAVVGYWSGSRRRASDG